MAEELIREALHPYPGDLKIATKAGLTRSGPGEWAPCGRPDYLRRQCEGSLRRLGVERIDLFQLHRVDPDVPADDQFGVLQDAARRGQGGRGRAVRGQRVDQIEAARRIVPIVSVQNQYNIAQRGADDVVDYCERAAASASSRGSRWPAGSCPARAGRSTRWRSRSGATASQVCLAWLLRRSPVMLPIPGTSSVEHLEENCAAAAHRALPTTQFEELTDARKPLRRWALAG